MICTSETHSAQQAIPPSTQSTQTSERFVIFLKFQKESPSSTSISFLHSRTDQTQSSSKSREHIARFSQSNLRLSSLVKSEEYVNEYGHLAEEEKEEESHSQNSIKEYRNSKGSLGSNGSNSNNGSGKQSPVNGQKNLEIVEFKPNVYSGKIASLMSHKNFGFIQPDVPLSLNGSIITKQIFFSFCDIGEKRLKQHCTEGYADSVEVTYRLMSYKNMKGKSTDEIKIKATEVKIK